MAEKINVQGIAIKSGLSRNNIMYLPEELKKFAKTMRDRPILKDHISHTDNVIGLITRSTYDEINETVPFKGWIKDDETHIIEKIEDERIKEVSIGAMIGHLAKETEDSKFYIAKDIEGLELSTTPTPGVRGTSITQALKEIEKFNENSGSIKEKVRITPIFEDLKKFRTLAEKDKMENKENIMSEKDLDTKEINYNSENQNIEKVKEEENRKMAEEEKTIKEKLSEKEAKVKQLQEDLENMKLAEKEAEEKRLQEELDKRKAEETLKREEEKKKVQEMEEENKRLKEELAKKPITEDTKENKLKGKVNLEKKEDNNELGGYSFEGYVFGKDEECKGDAIYRENYNDDKFKRLRR